MRCPYVCSRTERIVTLKETVIDLRKESANESQKALEAGIDELAEQQRELLKENEDAARESGKSQVGLHGFFHRLRAGKLHGHPQPDPRLAKLALHELPGPGGRLGKNAGLVL